MLRSAGDGVKEPGLAGGKVRERQNRAMGKGFAMRHHDCTLNPHFLFPSMLTQSL
jgi:hypothetical protein